MSIHSNIQPNLDRVAELLKEMPDATHIYMRRDDEVLVDIPLAQITFTIKQYPLWLVEGAAGHHVSRSIFPEDAPPLPPDLEVPPKPSEQESASPPARKPRTAKNR